MSKTIPQINASKTAARSLVALLSALLLGQIAPLQSANSASPAEKKPIRIGFLTSTTGVVGEAGQSMVNGFQLYLDQIHYQMDGRKVELIVENDESRRVSAQDKTQKLVDKDKVDVISGINLTTTAYAVAPIVEKSKTPLIITVAGADDLTQRQHLQWVVRPAVTGSQASFPFGQYAYKTLGYRRIVTFGMDYGFSHAAVGGFQQTFEEAGGKVIQKIWVPLGFKDFTPFIKQIRKDADAIFVSTTGGPAAVFPKQYRDAGLKLPIIGNGAGYDETVLSSCGDETIGTLTVFPYSAALQTAANKQFVKLYRAKYGVDPGYFSASGYVSGMWINKAVESLKGDLSDKDKLMSAIRTTVLKETPIGPVKLDDHGNGIVNIYVRKVERIDGHLQNKVVTIFPSVSEFWKYDPAKFLQLPSYSADYPPCRFCQEGK